VLVVGREEAVRDLLVEILDSLGYATDVAIGADEALAAMRRRPSAVVLDSLDPSETRRLLDERRHDADLARLPIALLAPRGPLTGWYELGVGAVVRKPFRTMDLLRALRALNVVPRSARSD
jgi:CheY-like chemotaxis protein